MVAGVDPRFSQLPKALAQRTVFARFEPGQLDGGIPALLAHPDEGWSEPSAAAPTPRPVVIWMHGRTVNKELDPGRYLRWLRAPHGGIATCAIDLPGHGDRFEKSAQGSQATLEVVEKACAEIDRVLENLRAPKWRGAFDLSRAAIGGMSAGGMVALTRLCRPHRFRCAAVESTAGDFQQMNAHEEFFTRGGRDPEGELATRLNPMARLEGWRPIPFLALHSERDSWVPVAAIRTFTEALKNHYRAAGADPAMVNLTTWPETGAPNEHAGFGRVANDAKNLQTEFFVRNLAAGGA